MGYEHVQESSGGKTQEQEQDLDLHLEHLFRHGQEQSQQWKMRPQMDKKTAGKFSMMQRQNALAPPFRRAHQKMARSGLPSGPPKNWDAILQKAKARFRLKNNGRNGRNGRT